MPEIITPNKLATRLKKAALRERTPSRMVKIARIADANVDIDSFYMDNEK